MIWILKHPRVTQEWLGFLPQMFSDMDPRPAREQVNANYGHGGGWRPFAGFTMTEDGLEYPGDPVMGLVAETRLRDEVIRVFESDWVVIIQPDGSWEASRMD
jgi:hypothetical protein